jgi:hypothetical protein
MTIEFQYREISYEGHRVHIPITPYKYQAFSEPRQIRLLKILPSKDKGDPIRYRLQNYRIDDSPSYTALSYQWGNPIPWKVISIDNTPFPIGQNLDKAIRELRNRKASLLWIDAISIDQDKEKEKSAQIPLMKDVYHQADHVAVWIGPESDGSEKIMKILVSIKKSRQPSPNKPPQPWTPSSELLTKYRIKLDAFVKRPFWRRVWIIQEIVTGSNVPVLCGPRVASWSSLEILLQSLQSNTSFDLANAGYVKHLVSTRKSRSEGHAIGLLQALSSSNMTEATILRDNVFALLGLTFDGPQFVRSPSYEEMSEEAFCL